MEIVMFGELVASNNFLFFLLQKLHLINPFSGLGTYLQGIPIQNTVDFIWGTDSGIRSLPVSFYLYILQNTAGNNWHWIYLALTLVLPFIYFCFALRIYKKIDIFVYIGALFYTTNTWIINRLLSGFWQLNIVYALLPFLITIPLSFVQKEKISKKSLFFWSILFSLFSSIIMIAQPHFLLMILFFLALHIAWLLITRRKNQVNNLLLLYVTSCLLFMCINIYFFLPSILFQEKAFTAPSQYFSLASVLFNGTGSTLMHVLQLSPVGFPFIEPRLGFAEKVQFIQLVLVCIFFFIKQKKEWLFFIALAVFIFLAKGVNQPLAGFSKFLYSANPLMHFFRDPTRFIGAVSLFGSFIIAFYTNTRKMTKIIKMSLLIIICSILLVANMRNIQALRSDLDPIHIPQQYVAMQQFINTIHTTNRLFILPNQHGYNGYSFYHGTPLPPSATLYDMVLPLTIPLADSSQYPDTYSSQMAALTYNEFTNSYNTNILQPLGIQYILTDAGIVSPPQERFIATSAAQFLTKKTDIRKEKDIANLTLFSYTKTSSLVTTEKPLFAIGNLRTIMDIHEHGINRPVILLNQSINTNALNNPILHGQDLFIDDSQPLLTLSAEELTGKFAVDILKSVWDYDKSLVNCEPAKMAYIVPTGNLFTSGRCVQSGFTTGLVTIPTRIQKGSYRILLKAMDVGTASIIGLQINNRIIKQRIVTGKKLKWIDLGTQTVTKNNANVHILILDKNEIVIDNLLFVPINAWKNGLKENKQIISQMKPVSMQDIGETQKSNDVAYIGINKVSTNKTKYLTYRFSWGKWWRSDKPSVAFISDGYGMTFIATEGVISSISYLPDIVYPICIIISIVVVVSLIIYLIWYMKRKKYDDKFRLFKRRS